MQQQSVRKKIADALNQIGRRLSFFTGTISAALLFCMTSVVLLGIVYRYILRDPLQWTEELARFLMLWVGFLAMNTAMYYRKHLAIDSFVGILPSWAKILLGYVCDVLILIFLTVLIIKGYSMTNRTIMRASSMEFSMFWVYLSVPLGALLTLIQHILQIGRKILGDSTP